jgi:N6-adenosine-specific RNA methylase IME4
VTAEQFRKLRINDRVIPKGLIFVWAPKELIPQTVKTMSGWGFLYVENLVWVKKSVNNKIVTQPYKYFARSKESLLIFRKFCRGNESHPSSKKDWHLELRHQRNPDVIFDFLRSKSHGVLVDEEKPEFTYNIIETLLPDANYDAALGRGQFLELWGGTRPIRKGWTVVSVK